MIYRLEISSPRTITTTVVDRGAVNVEVAIVSGGACRGSGSVSATAEVSGEVFVVVRSIASHGEFLLVVD